MTPQTIAIGQRTGLAWDVSDQVLFRAYGLAMRLIFRVAVGLGLPGAWTRRLNFDV